MAKLPHLSLIAFLLSCPPCFAATTDALSAPGRNFALAEDGAPQATGTAIVLSVMQDPEQAKLERDRESVRDRRQARELRAQERAAAASERQIWPSWFSVFLNFAGTALIIWTLLLNHRQLKIIKEDLESARAEAAITIEQATRSADAGRETANAAWAAVKSDRAWIWPGDVGVATANGTTFDGVPSGLIFMPHWFNAGRSPALLQQGGIYHIIADRNSEPPQVDVPLSRGEGVLAPGRVIGTPFVPLSLDDCERFRRQEIVIFIYSVITYFDVYLDQADLSNLRVSEFCTMGHHMGGNRIVDGRAEEAISFAAIGPQIRVT